MAKTFLGGIELFPECRYPWSFFASMKSGSLITAHLAAEQGRDVFSVPGSPLDPRASCSNALLKDGAGVVTHADDILQALSP